MSAEDQGPPTPPVIPTAGLRMELQAWVYVHSYLMLALRLTPPCGGARWRVHRVVEFIGAMLVRSGALKHEELGGLYTRERIVSGIMYSIPAVEGEANEQAKTKGSSGDGGPVTKPC